MLFSQLKAFSVPTNDEANVATYGRLYIWYAVNDSRNIAPEGWHIPSDEEWQTLLEYLGGGFVAGGKMKEAGYVHRIAPNTGATNSSGFCALPGGYRRRYIDGASEDMGYGAYLWSSTDYDSDAAWRRGMGYDGLDVFRLGADKRNSFSIRCVKD